MPFSYYTRLSPRDRAVYRESDAVTALALPGAETLHPLVADLRGALEREDRAAVEAVAGRLALDITRLVGAPRVALSVLAVRPSSRWGALHGLYTREPRRTPRIPLWMRTVRHKRVVAFRTFLRTLLHEVGHHLDYEHLRLRESFHTEGFFKRESSLFRQLVPEPADGAQDSESPRPGRK
jgi:hypothetical protein